MFLRYFLPIYLVIYVCSAFGWRTYRVWRATGLNPVTFKSTDSAHDFIGRLFKLLFALITLAVVVYSASPFYYEWLSRIALLDREGVRWSGVVLLLVSLLWTVTAQAQMGLSWRIGIDEQNRTPLVEHGLFAYSRNPIYVGMILTLAGLFLTTPNVVTLLTLVVGVVLIGVQVRLEEEFLTRTHGETYVAFKSRVHRWLGRR